MAERGIAQENAALGIQLLTWTRVFSKFLYSTMVTRSGSGAGSAAAATGPGAVVIIAAVAAGLVVGAGGLMAVLRCQERGSKAVTGRCALHRHFGYCTTAVLV